MFATLAFAATANACNNIAPIGNNLQMGFAGMIRHWKDQTMRILQSLAGGLIAAAGVALVVEVLIL